MSSSPGEQPGCPATDELPPAGARRRLIASLAVGMGAATLIGHMGDLQAAARELPMLKDSDPAAQATKYVSDAHRATGAQPGASCSNCSLFGSVSPKAGTCSLFPSNLVAADGWCSAWSGF